MLSTRPIRTSSRNRRLWALARPRVELLEGRLLLSGSGLGDADPTDVPDILDPTLAPNLLTSPTPGAVSGLIVNRADGGGDVDWYRFDLASASTVVLRQTSGTLAGALSLYNMTEPFDPVTRQGDRHELLGHRLLTQAVGTATSAPALVRHLAAGAYYVAVSGAGNQHFHPYLAGSGYPGQTGDYGLQLTITSLGLNPTAGPAVLAVEPTAASVLNAAPLVIRLSLSAPLDPGVTAELRGPNGPVALEWTNFSPQANELQLAPARPLEPGSYRVVALTGSSTNVLATFEVAGVEGTAGNSATADDHRPAPGETGGAHELGDVLGGGLVQRAGAIGDDPRAVNLASDVDLYHFEITADGTYALAVEVLAGRIGSPLDPGVSLFRLNEHGLLELVAANDNTFNLTPTADGRRLPLFNDSLLSAGLTRGHYYLAVSSSGPVGFGNVPNPAFDLLPGTNGVFDPNVSHSGTNGTTTGAYVLSLVVFEDAVAPEVVSATPSAASTVGTSPTQVVIDFSEAVNLPELANAASQSTFPFPPEAAPAFVRGADGTAYYLRLLSYDPLANRATFLLPQGLPNGAYEVHLAGVTDLAGNALAGSVGGDFAIGFRVEDPGAGSGPRVVTVVEPPDPSLPQDLGVLDLAGIIARRDFSSDPLSAPFDFADLFVFQMPVTESVVFTLSPLNGSALPEGMILLVTDLFGVPVPAATNVLGNGIAVIAARLEPGNYLVQVGFWDGSAAAGVSYQLGIARSALPENPPPLTTGPAPSTGLLPAVRFQLPPSQQQTPSTPPPPVNVLGGGSTGSTTGSGITLVVNEAPFLSFARLPPGSLTFLSAGPLGGVGGAAGSEALVAGSRLQLDGLNTAFVAALVRLTTLTPVTYSGWSDTSGEDLPDDVRASLGLIGGSWSQFLDGLFSRADWMRDGETPSSPPEAEPAEPEDTEPEVILPQEDSAEWSPEADLDWSEAVEAAWTDEFFTDDVPEEEVEAAEMAASPVETAAPSLAWALALAAGGTLSARPRHRGKTKDGAEETDRAPASPSG